MLKDEDIELGKALKVESYRDFQVISNRMLIYFRAGGAPLDVTVEKHGSKRTEPQRKFTFGPVYDKALQYYKDNPDKFYIDVLHSLRIGFDKVTMHEMFKRLLANGKSTSKMTKEEMTEFDNNIAEYMLHEHGIDIIGE